MVLGSDGVVSAEVQGKLKAFTTGSVERWHGPDRYASSAAFSFRSFTTGVDVAYIATGEDFPDALSAAPVAGVTGGPILLTRPGQVPAPIATELDRLKPKRIVVLGSAGVVSTEVQGQLKAYTTGTVDRWSGTDRFASASNFSSNAFAPGVDVAYIATGLDFPDALSGAPIAGMTRGPVLLANPSSLPSATSAELTRLRPKKHRRARQRRRGQRGRRDPAADLPALGPVALEPLKAGRFPPLGSSGGKSRPTRPRRSLRRHYSVLLCTGSQ